MLRSREQPCNRIADRCAGGGDDGGRQRTLRDGADEADHGDLAGAGGLSDRGAGRDRSGAKPGAIFGRADLVLPTTRSSFFDSFPYGNIIYKVPAVAVRGALGLELRLWQAHTASQAASLESKTIASVDAQGAIGSVGNVEDMGRSPRSIAVAAPPTRR
jgi:hypothetical protein